MAINQAAEETAASKTSPSEKIALNQAAQEALASEYTAETEKDNSTQKPSSESEEKNNKTDEIKKDNTNQLALKL